MTDAVGSSDPDISIWSFTYIIDSIVSDCPGIVPVSLENDKPGTIIPVKAVECAHPNISFLILVQAVDEVVRQAVFRGQRSESEMMRFLGSADLQKQ